MYIFRYSAVIISALFCSCSTLYPGPYNLDFEHTDGLDRLTRWEYNDQSAEEYVSRRDTLCRYRGRSSLRLERSDSASRGPVCFYQMLPDSLVAGHEVELSGWIRTEGDPAERSNLLLALPRESDNGPVPFQDSEFCVGSAHHKHSSQGGTV